MAGVMRMQGGVGESLSPTQVKTLLSCPAKWYFKYVLGLKEVADGALALGRAVHRAAEYALRWRLAKREPKLEEVRETFVEAFRNELREAELREDEDAAELEATGEALTELWFKEAAPRIQPQLVEAPASGVINGVPVNGRVDLVEKDGTIVDLKTVGRSPSEVDADHVFQVATYTLLLGTNGKARVDHLVKNKTPKLVSLEYQVSQEDLRFVQTMYPLARDVMASGLYPPNRASRTCSRRYCSFWRQCQQEFGGEVKP